MKGYMIGFILLLSNILCNIIITDDTAMKNIITKMWLEFMILGYIFKFIYSYYIKDKLCYYTMYLVNKNKSIWTSYYNYSMLLPSHFICLLVAEYCANTDREYLYIIDNINYSDITILLGLIYYYYYNIYLLILFQFFIFIKYTINYIYQINSNKSVNMNSIDFPTGYLLLKRPLFYFNIIYYIIMPCYFLLY